MFLSREPHYTSPTIWTTFRIVWVNQPSKGYSLISFFRPSESLDYCFYVCVCIFSSGGSNASLAVLSTFKPHKFANLKDRHSLIALPSLDFNLITSSLIFYFPLNYHFSFILLLANNNYCHFLIRTVATLGDVPPTNTLG